MKILIRLNNITKHYGSTELFSGVNAAIGGNHKIGFIGRNGSGKTTLCKLITGEEEPNKGVVERNPDLRLSYLEQKDPFRKDETVIEFLQRYTKQEEWKCGKVAGRFHIKNELLTETPLGKLSGGFQTRIKLIAMLLSI